MTRTETIHLSGYPSNTRTVTVSTPTSSAARDMHLHRQDLEAVRNMLDAARDEATPEKLRGYLWNSAISTYCKCFQASNSRARLRVDEVLAGLPENARKAFDYFMNLRNKHLLHDDNAYSQARVAAVVCADSEQAPIAGLHVLTFTADTLDESHFVSFQMLLSHTTYWASAKGESLLKAVRDELANLTREELLSLPPLQVAVPTVESVKASR